MATRPKVPARVEHANPLTAVDKYGYYVGEVPIVQAMRAAKTVHIRKQTYAGDIDAMCGANVDFIVGRVHPREDQVPGICSKCRKLVAQGERYFER